MERRDYLMDQIHELGMFIARLIGRLQKRKDDGADADAFTDAEDAFSVQFGWDLEELLFLGNASFIALMEENLLVDEHFEQLSAVFELLGDSNSQNQTLLRKELYYAKAHALLRLVDKRSLNYSLSRRDKLIQLELKMANPF